MPILTGDLVQFEDRRWRVKSYDKTVRTCLLVSWKGETQEVPDDADGFKLVARPQKQWPFVAGPTKRLAGPVVRVTWDGRELEPLVDWVPGSMGSSGGPIFFNPGIGLGRGDVLVGHHENGISISRINITPAFGTVQRRKARAKKPVVPRTAGERIRGGEDLFEDGFDE